jgi:ornithine cyclodeaminase/alanine dehydrogenase
VVERVNSPGKTKGGDCRFIVPGDFWKVKDRRRCWMLDAGCWMLEIDYLYLHANKKNKFFPYPQHPASSIQHPASSISIETIMPLYLSEQNVTDLLTMEDTLAAVEAVFNLQATGEATNAPRRRVRAAGAVLHVMSGAVADFGSWKGVLGLKAYTVTRRGARFHVSLYDAESGELLALIEADKLGQMRTGAASGVATKFLARVDAKTLGVYGTGWQARSQLEAVCSVRDIKSVKVYSRSPENRLRFCLEMSSKLNNVDLAPVDQPEAAAEADIIVTITNSRDPVLHGSWLKDGTHLNAAGGNSLLRRELDDDCIKRSSLITVDSIDQARLEAGEFVTSIEKGLLTWERVKELRHIINGRLTGRTSDREITLFKSLGIAIEDIATAAVLYQKAKAQNVGREF